MTNNTKTVKAPNFTAEQTAKMVADYKTGVTVGDIAAELGKSVRSITMKLVREKVYVKKEYTTKKGEAVTHKDTLADTIGRVLNMTEAEVTSLTAANKTALEKIMKALANSKPI